VGTGDGGSAGDPQNHAQDLSSLLGKMLRIDVEGGGADRPYGIPSDNPTFKDKQVKDARREIFAYGLRNPWRFSFDRQTGELWTGDVGQNSHEEIDIIRKGGNYGWRIMEGKHCFKPRICNKSGLELPVH